MGEEGKEDGICTFVYRGREREREGRRVREKGGGRERE